MASTEDTLELLVFQSIPEELINLMNLFRETSKDSKSMSTNSSFFQEVKRPLKEDMEDLPIPPKLSINVFRIKTRPFYQSTSNVLPKRPKRSLRK